MTEPQSIDAIRDQVFAIIAKQAKIDVPPSATTPR